MSRNGAGVYSLPAGSTVSNGDTSDASDINTPIADIAADLNIARPVVAGGTGASTAAGALVNLGLTATAAEINVMDGVTASTAELNILDGATLTVTELNYVDGVTSAIQTQLDAKQPLDADLTALAGLASAGMIARTEAGTVAARTLTAGTGISISNGDGVAGNPTITNTVTAGGMTLLGTLTTTSGTTQTLSGLTLTDYIALRIVIQGVSTSSNAATLTTDSGIAISSASTTSSQLWYGFADVDLLSGMWWSNVYLFASSDHDNSVASFDKQFLSSYTTASTSVSFSFSSGGTPSFDAGSIRIYGVK